MVFKHPSGIPTKAWYDDYGYLMVKGWKYKAVIALFGAWCIVRKFVAWYVSRDDWIKGLTVSNEYPIGSLSFTLTFGFIVIQAV